MKSFRNYKFELPEANRDNMTHALLFTLSLLLLYTWTELKKELTDPNRVPGIHIHIIYIYIYKKYKKTP